MKKDINVDKEDIISDLDTVKEDITKEINEDKQDIVSDLNITSEVLTNDINDNGDDISKKPILAEEPAKEELVKR